MYPKSNPDKDWTSAQIQLEPIGQPRPSLAIYTLQQFEHLLRELGAVLSSMREAEQIRIVNGVSGSAKQGLFSPNS